MNPAAEYLPVEKVENGVIYTRDHRYVKLIEVIPVNFLLRSAGNSAVSSTPLFPISRSARSSFSSRRFQNVLI